MAHRVLQELGWEYTEYEENKDSLVGHIDILDNGTLIELKTTRKLYIILTEADVPITWKKQIMAYAYMAHQNTVNLVVLYDMHAKIEAYTMHFTNEELKKNWEELQERYKLLQDALNKDDFTILPKSYKWECVSCEFKNICKERVKGE